MRLLYLATGAATDVWSALRDSAADRGEPALPAYR